MKEFLENVSSQCASTELEKREDHKCLKNKKKLLMLIPIN